MFRVYSNEEYQNMEEFNAAMQRKSKHGRGSHSKSLSAFEKWRELQQVLSMVIREASDQIYTNITLVLLMLLFLVFCL